MSVEEDIHAYKNTIDSLADVIRAIGWRLQGTEFEGLPEQVLSEYGLSIEYGD